MDSHPPTVETDEGEEYLYEFAFSPVEPIPDDKLDAYREAQRIWLEKWKPYSWHFRQ